MRTTLVYGTATAAVIALGVATPVAASASDDTKFTPDTVLSESMYGVPPTMDGDDWGTGTSSSPARVGTAESSKKGVRTDNAELKVRQVTDPAPKVALAAAAGGILYAYVRARRFDSRSANTGKEDDRQMPQAPGGHTFPIPAAGSEVRATSGSAHGNLSDAPAAPVPATSSEPAVPVDGDVEARRIVFVRERFLTLLGQCSIGGIATCCLMDVVAASAANGDLGIIVHSEYGPLRLVLFMLAFAMFGCGIAIARRFGGLASRRKKPVSPTVAKWTLLAYGLFSLALFVSLMKAADYTSSFAVYYWDSMSGCVALVAAILGTLPATMAFLAHCKSLERGNMAANVLRTTMWLFLDSCCLLFGVMCVLEALMYCESVQPYIVLSLAPLVLGGIVELLLAVVRFLVRQVRKLRRTGEATV